MESMIGVVAIRVEIVSVVEAVELGGGTGDASRMN